MRDSVFITGATGFVGRHVLAQFGTVADPVSVLALARRVPPVASGIPGLSWIQGDLQHPETYSMALTRASAVVHLAAPTGKVSASEARRVIVDGTATLLKAAADAGVPEILFVSSVAAGFTDRRHYPYAEAKLRAEELVRASRLASHIVRPTMVFGAASPIRAALAKLARLPIVPIFGRGDTLVQPIHVVDLARWIVATVKDHNFQGQTTTLGGRDRLRIQDLILKLRPQTRSKSRVWHLPVEPIRTILGFLEPVFLPLLPLTAGQMATFINPGVAEQDAIWRRLEPESATLESIVDEENL